jgi:antitoxin VapB
LDKETNTFGLGKAIMVEWWNDMVERWKVMALNIKDEETHRLASELARETGESLTYAVKVSIKERLERQRETRKREGRMEWLRELTARTAPLMNDGRTSKELMDELYDDETGLPK